MATQAAARGGAVAARTTGRAALLPAKSAEELKADRPRIKQLYRAGLPRAAYNLINIFSNRPLTPNQRAPTESTLSPNLDDRIGAANARLEEVLGKPLKAPENHTTWVIQRRGQHIPTGIIARDLKNRFWHRMFKGSRDAAQAINQGKRSKDSESDAK
ncbi:uncharacterized protein PV09_06872 [Verruconis gallopava]|uniref:Uncharacterized protein n=1 Tax=Verruconis gallopava TaxID=253628 RepID=A0A0D1XHI4_9PEZI|nr:uncharacterized protein PV09_06872 [Verruconis gallopava]KIW01691.1 hypothetical protein PV09_06872 [Verruconis gallopava]